MQLIVVVGITVFRRGLILEVALGHDVDRIFLVGEVDRHLDALQLGVQPQAARLTKTVAGPPDKLILPKLMR